MGDREFKYDIWDYNQTFSDNIFHVIMDLRGHYYTRPDDIILRLISFVFILGPALQLYNERQGSYDMLNIVACVFLLIMGIFLFLITIGFCYFDEHTISHIGLFKKKYWEIDKSQITSIEVITTRDNFINHYELRVHNEESVRSIPLDGKMKEHIEKYAGQPFAKLVSATEYRSLPINFRLVLNVLLFIVFYGCIIAAGLFVLHDFGLIHLTGFHP